MEKVIFNVDEITNHGNIGTTTDINKIVYNANILFLLRGQNFEEELNKMETGFATFFVVGKFMCYLNIKKDKSKGEIFFINTTQETDRALDAVNALFKDRPRLLHDFMKKHETLYLENTDEFDLVEIAQF